MLGGGGGGVVLEDPSSYFRISFQYSPYDVLILSAHLSSPAVFGQPTEECQGRLVSCIVNPCSVANCPAFNSAQCVPSYCNKCSAHFYIRGLRVSLQDCSTSVPVEIKSSGGVQVIRKTLERGSEVATPSPVPQIFLDLKLFFDKYLRQLG